MSCRPPAAQEAEDFWKRWLPVGHSLATEARARGGLADQRYWTNIVTSFRHRSTNAVSEGLNSTIQTITKMAYGFRNQDHFKTAIYLHCGGLDLYPR